MVSKRSREIFNPYAITLRIDAGDSVAKYIKVLYKGEEIQGTVTAIEMFLCRDNLPEDIDDLFYRSCIRDYKAKYVGENFLEHWNELVKCWKRNINKRRKKKQSRK